MAKDLKTGGLFRKSCRLNFEQPPREIKMALAGFEQMRLPGM